MMISDLPHHLLEEILSRVPATTLRKLRPTCKQWNALLKDQLFNEKHHRKAPKQPLLLLQHEYRVRPVSVELDLSVVAAPSIEFNDALDLKGSHSSSQQVNIIEVIHCEGLLLCITKNRKLVVWNPLLGETKWIRHYKRRRSSFALGYKNNKSCRDYKILRLRQRCKEDEVDEFEIYELSSDSWRFLDGISLDYYEIHTSGCVSLQGNTYWVASDSREDVLECSIFLLSFDFTTERFRRLNLPPVLRQSAVLSIVRDEQISVLHTNALHTNASPLKIQLWVTNNFGTDAALSWSKSFEVDLHVPADEHSPMFTTFLLDEDKKVVVCTGLCGWYMKVYIIGEDGACHTKTPDVNSTDKLGWPRIFNCVPSLVQIQQPTQTRKRKRRMEQRNKISNNQKKRRHSSQTETDNVN